MISDIIKQFTSEYASNTSESRTHVRTPNLFVKDLPDSLLTTLNLDPAEYLIKGSVGMGNRAEIPWFAIMHKGITTSVQTGYYVVGLVSSDLSTLHLALGLGWTQFKEQYGARVGKEKVFQHAQKLASLIPGSGQFHKGKINLGARSERARGYEVSNAISVPIKISDLNDTRLIETLNLLIEKYNFIRTTYGADLAFNKELEVTEGPLDEDLLAKIRSQSSSLDKGNALFQLVSLSDTLPPEKRKRYVSEIIRNAAFANYVKKRANYICEICGKLPFTKANEQPYAEADHIEPLFLQGRDHPDNMRCVCAQCHRILTYGSLKEKELLSNHSPATQE